MKAYEPLILTNKKEVKMFKKRLAAVAITCLIALSAFAQASVTTATVEAQCELSQGTVDLGVQSANAISSELTQANSEAFQVEYSEAIKLQRNIEEAFDFKAYESDQLTVIYKVGWRRSYSL